MQFFVLPYEQILLFLMNVLLATTEYVEVACCDDDVLLS